MLLKFLVFLFLHFPVFEDLYRKSFEDNFPSFVLVKDVLIAGIAFISFIFYGKMITKIRFLTLSLIYYIVLVVALGGVNGLNLSASLIGYRNYIFYIIVAVVIFIVFKTKNLESYLKYIRNLSLLASVFSVIQFLLIKIFDVQYFWVMPFNTYDLLRVFEEGSFTYITSFWGTDVQASIFLLLFLIINIVLWLKERSSTNNISLGMNILSIVLIGKRSAIVVLIGIIVFFIVKERRNFKVSSFFSYGFYFYTTVFVLIIYYFLISSDVMLFYRTIPQEGKVRSSETIANWYSKQRISDLILGYKFGVKSQGVQHTGMEMYTNISPHESFWLKLIDEGGIVLLITYLFVFIKLFVRIYLRSKQISKPIYSEFIQYMCIYILLMYVWSTWHFGVVCGDKFLIIQWAFVGLSYKIFSEYGEGSTSSRVLS